MKKQHYFLLLFILVSSVLYAQNSDTFGRDLILIEGDSIPTYGIPLKEVVLFQPLRFKSKLELKKFSRSEGKILIRLVHRQTGITTFDLVKELRTGWKAFWYQTTASLFKLSLKDEYNPEYSFEDYLIEDILQRAFADKYLEEQPAALGHNLDDLYYIWKDKK